MPGPAVQRDPVCGDCPDKSVLTDLVLGKLPGEAIEQLSSHIETCSTCQSLLDTLDNLEDSVVADLKAASRPGQIDPNLEQQIQDAAKIGPAVWSGEAQRPTEADDFAGRQLGQYELQERIGRGGMGTVYKALHVRLKRHVAVKLLSSHRLRDPQAVARFAREMEAVGRLDHPHLVRAHDAGDADGLHYLTMELLDGTDLSRIVRKNGPLGMADASEVVRQAALALQYAHEHGLVHRDVKPSNLMLTASGQVKVLDLGLARLTSDTPQADEMTGSGQVVGTGDFIAPEQGQDTRNADARSDIYALGCTLYFLLAGRGPFATPEYATFMQKVMAHAQQPVPPISQFCGDLPSGLVAILQRMLHKAPDQRFQSAAQVAQALEPYVAGSDLSRVAAGSHQQVSESPLRPPASRRRYVWLTLLLLAIAAGGLAFWRAEIILLIRGEGVLVVTGERTDVEIVATPSKGTEVTLKLDDNGTARLKADQYEIRISGAESDVVLKPAQIKIRPASRTVVEISHSADLSSDVAASQSPPPDVLAVEEPSSREVENSIGMLFAWIPPGEFLRGSPETEGEREHVEGPQRKIQMTRSFYMGVHEVTQGQFRRVTGQNPSFFAASSGGAAYGVSGNTDNYPVDSVPWIEAVSFCKTLSELPAELAAGRTYRLPTEAEWEYACRARTTTPFHYGDSLSSRQANFKGEWPYGKAEKAPHAGRTVPVGSYEPNAFGLYDMHGNVWEWCQDPYVPDYYATSPDVDPPGPRVGKRHVFRGGGWGVNGSFCRSAYRSHAVEPQQYTYSMGFRVVMTKENASVRED